MRSTDLPEYNQKVKNWIRNGVANKAEIARGGTAYQKHLEDYQDLLNDAEQSKEARKFDEDAAKLKIEGKLDELDFPILDKHKESIYSPNFYKNPKTKQTYSITDFSANIPTWDVGKRKAFIDYATADFKPDLRFNEKEKYDQQEMAWTTTYDLKYSPDALKSMAQRANAIISDKSGFKTYSNILKGHGDPSKGVAPTDEFVQLSDAYHTLHPGELMDTPLKAAMADIILNRAGITEIGKPEKRQNKQGQILLGKPAQVQPITTTGNSSKSNRSNCQKVLD